jgi:hypothetical protein
MAATREFAGRFITGTARLRKHEKMCLALPNTILDSLSKCQSLNRTVLPVKKALCALAFAIKPESAIVVPIA